MTELPILEWMNRQIFLSSERLQGLSLIQPRTQQYPSETISRERNINQLHRFQLAAKLSYRMAARAGTTSPTDGRSIFRGRSLARPPSAYFCRREVHDPLPRCPQKRLASLSSAGMKHRLAGCAVGCPSGWRAR